MDAYTSNDMISRILILLYIFINVSNWCHSHTYSLLRSSLLLRPTISTECRGRGLAARSPGDPGERSKDVLARKSVAAIFNACL